MSKLVRLDTRYWPEGGYGHWCPGCDSGHEISVDRPNSSGAKWTFNNNRYKPSFSPSINMRINPKGHIHYQPDVASSVCHYFIKDGQIQFLADCTHALAGKTVELPDIPRGKYLTSERL
jgi:Family of unknown function (DUF6527)